MSPEGDAPNESRNIASRAAWRLVRGARRGTVSSCLGAGLTATSIVLSTLGATLAFNGLDLGGRNCFIRWRRARSTGALVVLLKWILAARHMVRCFGWFVVERSRYPVRWVGIEFFADSFVLRWDEHYDETLEGFSSTKVPPPLKKEINQNDCKNEKLH